MQKEEKILPEFLNLDISYEKMLPNESPFIKNVSTDFNANPENGNGDNNPTQEGQNVLALTPLRSNIPFPGAVLPAGYNKNIGYFFSDLTNEGYYFNYNAVLPGIYLLDGNTGLWSKIIEDITLNFSDDQQQFMAGHRVLLWIVRDNTGAIITKYLLTTDGANWQKWINVVAAVSTNGFDASRFPYWNLLPPHFDRRELIEWASRPCMYNPKVVPIPNTSADIGKVNRMVDQGFQFAQVFNMTDGRTTALSPYSLPLIIKSEDFLNNPDNLPKNALLTLYAGSCMVESIDLYVRKTAKQTAGAASTVSWGKWLKYLRIYKFTNCGVNDAAIIGTEYWTRTNPWAGLNYDPILNAIQYTFDNSILADIPTIDPDVLQNDIPQTSVALTPIGDAALLGNNRYGYPNLDCTVTGNMSVEVVEKPSTDCIVPQRKIRLYAYVGMCSDDFAYFSQVGYIDGSDTTVRFGSLRYGGNFQSARFNINESKTFGLDFGDKKAFRVYLKGTPYFADGTWYQVNSDNSLVKIPNELDFSNVDTLTYIQSVGLAQGYFVCVFDLVVPAGRYIATLGRHNVDSSGDYRNTSTYIEGIANSRIKSFTVIDINAPVKIVTTIKPNAVLAGYSKEMELDCTGGDIDVWGNGHDLFYVYCPYITNQGNREFRFIEGYLEESPDSPLGVEKFAYIMTTSGQNVSPDDSGNITDKNGFYFAYTKRNDSDLIDMRFICKLNCAYPFIFTVITNQQGSGWKTNAPAYISDHNNGVVGDCNRIIYSGKITSIDGTVGYSNIGISIVDGETVYTKTDGTFELVVHNGLSTLRVSNVYVNAGGDFLITTPNCGFIPLFNFNEALSPCVNCTPRNYPVILILGVNPQGGTQFSLKENGYYSIGVAGTDLAGRLWWVNIVQNITVPSFLQRDDILATFFRLLLTTGYKLPNDMAWFAPYVSPQLGVIIYLQWIGDSVVYVDANGLVVSDPASAVFISISIQSLYNNNISKNFTLLSNYQFTPGDRLRVLDDGNGNLLDVATYGEPIDVQILGNNYNQAAMAADLIPQTNLVPVINNTINSNTTVNTAGTPAVTTSQTTQNQTSITLYIRYDSRFDKLVNNNGIWIEIYTPYEQTQEIKFNELEWKPVINNAIANFTGYSNGKPVYNFPSTIDINFWDTYFFSRSITIPGVGDRFFAHPFESPNISDAFGAGVTSGGRQWVKNDNAQQLVYDDDVIRSDELKSGSIPNGLGTFRSTNRKSFSQNPFGGILAMITRRSIILFICENDWFVTNFDYHFTYPNASGVMVVNLDNGISTPAQKTGDNFGMSADDTGSVVIFDKYISWYDSKNEAYVICDYHSAQDVSDITDEQGRKYGIKSYLRKKTQFIKNWNLIHDNTSRCDVVCGIDPTHNKLHLTFRFRRGNSNDLTSYVNQRRNVQLNYQETVVYSIDEKRWKRFTGFTPESYGIIKGDATGVQLISIGAGIPYTHNGNTFITFFGQLTEPVLIPNFNKDIEAVKILQSISFDCNLSFLVDLIYSDEPNSYSYIPVNFFGRKENLFYSQVQRNLNSYPKPNPNLLFQSMFTDGKRTYGTYFLCRFVGNPKTNGQYFQLTDIYYLYAYSEPVKK